MKHYPEKPLIQCVLSNVESHTIRDPQAWLRYIGMEAVDSVAKVILPVDPTRRSQAPAGAFCIVRSGDVLLCDNQDSYLPFALAVPFHADGCAVSRQFRVLRPDPALLDTRFLFHMAPIYCSSRGLRFGKKKAKRRQNDEQALAAAIPLPTLAEQRHIADIVDGLETTRINHLAGWLTTNALICEMLINIYEGKLQAWAQLE